MSPHQHNARLEPDTRLECLMRYRFECTNQPFKYAANFGCVRCWWWWCIARFCGLVCNLLRLHGKFSNAAAFVRRMLVTGCVCTQHRRAHNYIRAKARPPHREHAFSRAHHPSHTCPGVRKMKSLQSHRRRRCHDAPAPRIVLMMIDVRKFNLFLGW